MTLIKPGTFVSTRYGDGIILGNTYAYNSRSSSIKSRKQKDNQNKTVQANISVSNIVDVDIDDKDDESLLIEKSARRSKYGQKTSRRSIGGEKQIVDLNISPTLVKVQLSYGIAYISIQDLHTFDKFLSVDISSSTRVGLGSHSINRKDLFLCSPKQLFNDSLVNLYIETIQKKVANIHITNTFFYTIICSFITNKSLSMEEREKKFSKLSKLFQMEGHLLVPVNYMTHWSLAIICNIHLLKARSEEVSALRKRKEDSNVKAKPKDLTDNAIEFSNTSSGRKRKSTAAKPALKVFTKAPVSLYDELMQSTDTNRELPCILLLDSAKCHRAQLIFANLRIYLQLMLFGAASFPLDASPDTDIASDIAVDATEKSLLKNAKDAASTAAATSAASSRKRKRNTAPTNLEPPILIDLSEDVIDSDEVVFVAEEESLEVTDDPHRHESDVPVIVSDVPVASSEEEMDPMEAADLEALPCTDPVAHDSLVAARTEVLHSPVPTTELVEDMKGALECEAQNFSTAIPMDEEEEEVAEPSSEEVAADLKRGSEAPKAAKLKSSAKSSRPRKPDLLINPVSLPGFSLAVPLQMNGYDCGPFMLEFITKFSESTPTIDKAFLQAKGGDVFKRCWNTDSGTVDVMGCRSTILRHLMPYKEFLTSSS